MKILLVIPKFGEVDETEAFIPIGTAYINAAIRKAGFDVSGINLNYQSFESLKNKIIASDVVLCGGTAHDWEKLQKIFSFAKSINPQIITIGGGAGYSSAPILFSQITDVDYAVIGEGERTICNLLKVLNKCDEIKVVKGIVYKKGTEYFYTGPAPIIADFDSIDFPSYEDLGIDCYFKHQRKNRKQRLGKKNYFQFQYEYDEYPRELPMMLSRSCPFLCTFCFHTLGNKYRMRTLDNFFAELDELIAKYNINGIYLIDELFGLNERIITQFCDRIAKYNIRWFAEIRIETASSIVLDKMQKAGCQNVQFGVENICDDILLNMNKKTNRQGIEEALKNAYKTGMIVSGNMLVGAENETWNTFIENFDWWNHNRQYNLAMINIMQYPGSAYYEHCVERGIIKNQIDFIKAGMPILNMSQMSDYEWDKMNRMIRLAQCNKSFQGEIYKIDKNEDGTTFSISTECSYCKAKYTVKQMISDWKNSSIFTSNCPECNRRNVHDKVNHKRDFQFELQQQWILNCNHNENHTQWFEKRHFYNIVLWWNSELGYPILDMIDQNENMNILYIVDKTEKGNLNLRIQNHNIISENEVAMVAADCILVCEAAEFVVERRKIRKIGYEGKIVSSADIIFNHDFYLDDRENCVERI